MGVPLLPLRGGTRRGGPASYAPCIKLLWKYKFEEKKEGVKEKIQICNNSKISIVMD